MTQKTAVQTAIEESIKRQGSYNEIEVNNDVTKAAKDEMNRCFNEFRTMLKTLLPKERQDLIDAYRSGKMNGITSRMEDEENLPAKQYVHEKFGI